MNCRIPSKIYHKVPIINFARQKKAEKTMRRGQKQRTGEKNNIRGDKKKT